MFKPTNHTHTIMVTVQLVTSTNLLNSVSGVCKDLERMIDGTDYSGGSQTYPIIT